MDGAAWLRLAHHVKRERHRRALSRQAMASYIGISESTLRKIEKATYQPMDPWEILIKVETGMHWMDGSIDRIERGGAPKPKPDPDLARLQHAWPGLDPALRRVLADVAELHRQ